MNKIGIYISILVDTNITKWKESFKLIKSFCIKTNNEFILDYLLNNFKYNIPNKFYLSRNSFKIYDNVIFHYTGDSEELFVNYTSNLLKDVILKFYENKIINNIINFNYFYFSDIEKKKIIELCIENLNENNNSDVISRKSILFHLCKEYIEENKSVVLDGFVNFRIKEYINILDEIIETNVNSYIIEKEYNEFINLLKIYIDSKIPSNKTIHLIYFNNESILLDNEKNVIQLDTNISNAKYLSDITFSSNDYCLNTLLNILPKKIFIHILDKKEDEFITTLKSIFEKRISICYNCNLCKTYKLQTR